MMMERLRYYLSAIWAENLKEWKIELSYKVDFIRGFFEPFVFVLPYLLYGLALVGGRHSSSLLKLTGTGDIITFVVIGYIFMGFLNTALWGMGFALRKEQYYGTLESIFVSPLPRWIYVGGMALHSTMHQGLIIVIQMILIHSIFRLIFDIGGLLPSLIVIAIMLVALYGLGMMIAALALIYKQGWVISEALYSLISIITPIAYPISVLPLFLQKISKLLPTTYGILTVRHFLIGEEMGFSVGTSLARLFVLSMVWITFGLFIFSVVDRKTRMEGTLAHY
ncbi:MAG TPA: ABC transporter permease [Candidatus Latescibacteria bacterium]|nr:ABC transporter permease [Candidatus Latescibacterota bacterium]